MGPMCWHCRIGAKARIIGRWWRRSRRRKNELHKLQGCIRAAPSFNNQRATVMSGNTRILIIAAPVILLLLAIAVPNFIKPRVIVSMNACANNLRWIDDAKKEWAQQSHQSSNAALTEDDLRPFFKRGNQEPGPFPHCPSGGVYTLGAIGEPPRCSLGGKGHTLSPN